MIREATAMTVRKNLGELINEVQYRHDSIIVTKAGKKVAAIVDIDRFNKMRLLDKAFDQLVTELQASFSEETSESIGDLLQEAKSAS